MEETKTKWRGRTGGGTFGQWFLLTVLAHVRVVWLYPVLYFVIPFYMLFGMRSTKIMYAYFHRHHGYSALKAIGCVFRNYICFGKVVLDKFAVAAGYSHQFEVELNGQCYMEELLNGEKGFILASAHVGNFELVGHCLTQNRKQIYGIIYGGERKGYLKKRQDSFRESNVTLIPVSNDMSHLFAIKDALDNGNIVSLQCDRLFGSPKHIALPFLGEEASFPLGVFRIAAQLQVPVLSVFVMKISNRKYKAFVAPLQWDESCSNSTKQSMALCIQYVAKLEEILKEYPLQWFNYYDFWKE